MNLKGVKNPLILSQVTGIGGKYQLSFLKKEEELEYLEQPQKVTFSLIHEKHNDMEKKEGCIVAMSKKEAILVTDEKLEPYDNLEIMFDGKKF